MAWNEAIAAVRCLLGAWKTQESCDGCCQTALCHCTALPRAATAKQTAGCTPLTDAPPISSSSICLWEHRDITACFSMELTAHWYNLTSGFLTDQLSRVEILAVVFLTSINWNSYECVLYVGLHGSVCGILQKQFFNPLYCMHNEGAWVA